MYDHDHESTEGKWKNHTIPGARIPVIICWFIGTIVVDQSSRVVGSRD